jgi:hypothetical protein
MTKPLLPTATDALLGIYRAALADVPEGATERPASEAARAILARFTPQPQQIGRWLEIGLAREIHRLMVIGSPYDDEC